MPEFESDRAEGSGEDNISDISISLPDATSIKINTGKECEGGDISAVFSITCLLFVLMSKLLS
uniref:Uncharacterized protein n=1 Tax=Timema bartmani TaxID=61472 RepID=A0A7R9I509_9NEOP|nr:unnamed protein product [Timema bartmani]